jgi:hypothetical protein
MLFFTSRPPCYKSVKIWFSCEDFPRIALLPSSIVLVLEWRSNTCCALVDPVLFRIEAPEQFGQHRYDANQPFFVGLYSIQRGKSFGHRSIQAGCAFDGRAACIIKEFGSAESQSL